MSIKLYSIFLNSITVYSILLSRLVSRNYISIIIISVVIYTKYTGIILTIKYILLE